MDRLYLISFYIFTDERKPFKSKLYVHTVFLIYRPTSYITTFKACALDQNITCDVLAYVDPPIVLFFKNYTRITVTFHSFIICIYVVC